MTRVKLTQVPVTKMLENRRQKVVRKQMKRKGFNSRGKRKGDGFGYQRIGNKDWGCPYHGKDRYAGQLKKMGDRLITETNDQGEQVLRLFVYDNSKYSPQGRI